MLCLRRVEVNETLPKIRKTILIRKSKEESFAVNLGSGEMFSLNETAAKILELCKEGVSLEKAVEIIAKEFQGTPSEVEKDIRSTLEDFRKLSFFKEE
jgi:hypothetical protein